MRRLEPSGQVSLILRDARKSALLWMRTEVACPGCCAARQRCAADPGSKFTLCHSWSRLCEAARRAPHRVRDTV